MRHFLAAIIVLAGLAGHSTALAETKTLTVNGMVCSFCAQGIEKKFKERAEVQNVHVNLKEKSVAIDFKEGQSIPDAEIEAILKDAGYAVVKK